MADVYKTSGNFYDSDDTLRLDFNIEAATDYHFYKKYDISQVFQKADGSNYTINGVVIYLKKAIGSNNNMVNAAAGTWHPLPALDQAISKYTPYAGIGTPNKFDFKEQNALVILYHDDTFEQEHIDWFYKDLKKIYNDMVANNMEYQMIDMPEVVVNYKKQGGEKGIDDDGGIIIRPRTAGLTIITRKP